MISKTIIAGVLVILAVIAVAVALGRENTSDHPGVDPQIAKHQNYHQAQYDAGIVNAWPQGASDRRVGAYLESSWRYPVNRAAAITIYSRAADGASSGAAAAELARIQTNKLPDYREGSLNEIELRGIPAARWSFDLGGASYVEYFFEECDVDFVVRGSAPSDVWNELADLFHAMVTEITAKCDG